MDRTQQLQVDQWLNPGDTLTSMNKAFVLVMQDDGNLVQYQVDAAGTRGASTWASNTSGKAGAKAVMQNDGNFVVYAADGKTPLWSSHTAGHPGTMLQIGDDGLVIIGDGSPTPVWSSSGHPAKAITDAAESALGSLKGSLSKLTGKPENPA